MPVHHKVKCSSSYFELTVQDRKPFELRLNDRNYQTGDTITLEEVRADNTYITTGRERIGEIMCVISGPPWLRDGYVALGIKFE